MNINKAAISLSILRGIIARKDLMCGCKGVRSRDGPLVLHKFEFVSIGGIKSGGVKGLDS